MSMLEGNLVIGKCVLLDTELERCIFTTSFIGATIQNGSKKERSNES